MNIVLFFTIVICRFGLLSAMYSTILERTLEIGIIRALGMKRYQVRRIFLAESNKSCHTLPLDVEGPAIAQKIVEFFRRVFHALTRRALILLFQINIVDILRRV